MKDRETQLAFIRARAEGKSYSAINKELGIAKATCTSWEHTFRSEIEALKREQLEELYTAYSMKKEARIKNLGEILQTIDTALAGKSLEDLPADKLLELRLKYGRELKAEYRGYTEQEADNTLEGLLEQYNRLYMDFRAGEYSPADIKTQLSILEAKKETLQKIAQEQDKEDPLSFDFMGYTSTLLRHEEGGE